MTRPRVNITFSSDFPQDFTVMVDGIPIPDVKMVRLTGGGNQYTTCIITQFVRDENHDLIGEEIDGEQHVLEFTYDLFDALEEKDFLDHLKAQAQAEREEENFLIESFYNEPEEDDKDE